MTTVADLLDRLDTDPATDPAELARLAGDRAVLEATRTEVQRRIRRDARDQGSLRALRTVSAALQELERDPGYSFFNSGGRRGRRR